MSKKNPTPINTAVITKFVRIILKGYSIDTDGQLKWGTFETKTKNVFFVSVKDDSHQFAFGINVEEGWYEPYPNINNERCEMFDIFVSERVYPKSKFPHSSLPTTHIGGKKHVIKNEAVLRLPETLAKKYSLDPGTFELDLSGLKRVMNAVFKTEQISPRYAQLLELIKDVD